MGNPNKNFKFLLSIVLALIALGLVLLMVVHGNFVLFNPKGIVALKERSLIVTAIGLMFIVVIPVFIATFYFAWKYRAGRDAEYAPDSNPNVKLELLWWAIPAAVIFVLAIINWKSAHDLDPYKPLQSAAKPLTIQVVSLRWKWLFIYPEQNIATVNFIEFPENVPVNFQLTSDASMNSFWIPQLGGQMYAMAGMQTQLHLMAGEPGEFNGSAAEINGTGFAGMKFIAKASSQADFYAWVESVKKSSQTLNQEAYNKLAEPSENNPATFYSSTEKNLYSTIMMKYMMPASTHMDMPGMEASK